ncbi:MAG: hypothetical protein WA902_13305 [Thermosynechococcaceae cyanobacterium]
MIFSHSFKLYQTLLAAAIAVTAGDTAAVRANSSVEASDQYAVSTPMAKSVVQLYGQVPKANQSQQGYFVFQQDGDQVVGAYYQPRSEFDCFVGNINNNVLDVDILSAFEEERMTEQISLSTLHSLDSPSADDEQILNVCRQQAIELQSRGNS